jgi:Holliday junction resolvase
VASQQPEGRLVNAIIAACDERGAWTMKVHGSMFGRRGIPDIVGCHRGEFFAFEAKVPPNTASRQQLREGDKIKAAGGRAIIVTDVSQVHALLNRIERDQLT